MNNINRKKNKTSRTSKIPRRTRGKRTTKEELQWH